MALDTLIRNGNVIDGTGAPRRAADVGISGGKIAAVGSLGSATAGRTIDATGLVVAPGFIDMHSHSDTTMLDDPGGESKAHQGVTTEVTGNCAFSPFPVSTNADFAAIQRASAPAWSSGWDWTDLDGWAAVHESAGTSLNIAPQVGQGRHPKGRRAERRPAAHGRRDAGHAPPGSRGCGAGGLRRLDRADRRPVELCDDRRARGAGGGDIPV